MHGMNPSELAGLSGRFPARKGRKPLLYATMVLLLIAAALGLRLWTAWTLRYSTDPNLAVNGIMTKQIVAGTGFPLFYLGQEQVGTVEFFVAAPFCRLWGCNGFTLNFGVILFGVSILLVVFFWARHLAGPAAGLAALALLVIGPEHFLRYTGGMGYAAITFTNAMVLALTGPIIERIQRAGQIRALDFLLLGFFAGLGWWSSPMIVFSIAAAGLALLIFLRWRILFWRVLAGGLAGFALGAAPWLIWNTVHGFASLKVGSALGAGRFLPNLLSFFQDTLYPLFGVRPLPGPIGVALACVIAALCLCVPVLIAQGLRRKDSPWRDRLPSLVTLALVLPVTALIYSLTRYGADHTPRYLLPLVPPGAVACAVAVTLLGRRSRRAWILLPLLILAQVPALKQYPPKVRQYAETHAQALQLAEFLRQQRLDAAYIPFLDRWLNFGLNEEFIFWPANGLRDEMYWERIERAPGPAVIGQSGPAKCFLEMTDGSAEAAHVAERSIRYHFAPPADGLAEISPNAISSIRSDQGEELKPILCDRMIESRWRNDPDADGWIDVHFADPVPLRAIRIEGGSRGTPILQLEGRLSGETEWCPLAGPMIPTDFSWWGPRLYWQGVFRRQEYRVRPREIEALRIRFAGGKRWAFSELRLFISSGPAPAGQALSPLLDHLEQHKPAVLHCDRWVGSQLRGKVPFRLGTETYVRDASDPPYDQTIELTPGLVLLVAAEDVAMTRDALAAARIQMAETPLGSWTLFDFGQDHWDSRYEGIRALYWTGSGALLAGARALSIGWMQMADSLGRRNGFATEAEELYRAALRALPRNKLAADRLAELMRKAGRRREAEETERSAAELWTPALPAAVEFPGGLQLLGLTIAPLPVERGKAMHLQTYWRCPPNRPAGSQAVFVHFLRDGAWFQGDHPLAFDGQKEQPDSWVFVLENAIDVPAGIPGGSYQIEVGVFNPATGKRLSARTDLKARQNAVRMTSPVEVR
jgi:hypothetical protein